LYCIAGGFNTAQIKEERNKEMKRGRKRDERKK
jgi:hypothetical protein